MSHEQKKDLWKSVRPESRGEIEITIEEKIENRILRTEYGIIQIVICSNFPMFLPPFPPMFVIVCFGYTTSPCKRLFSPSHPTPPRGIFGDCETSETHFLYIEIIENANVALGETQLWLGTLITQYCTTVITLYCETFVTESVISTEPCSASQLFAVM